MRAAFLTNRQARVCGVGEVLRQAFGRGGVSVRAPMSRRMLPLPRHLAGVHTVPTLGDWCTFYGGAGQAPAHTPTISDLAARWIAHAARCRECGIATACVRG